jgi:exopolysaccharide biosynthesis protein
MNLQFPTAKISIALMSTTLALCLVFPVHIHAASPTNYESQTLSYQGKSYTIKRVTVDLKDPMIRVRPVVAAEGIGHVESFSSMMERSSAIAGINGTFFNAYEKDDSIRYPNGLLIHSGEIMHSGDNQAFEVLANKSPRLQKVHTELKINVAHNGKTYPIRPWGVNKYYGEAETDQVVWYTTEFGKTIDFPNATKIIIRDGVITAISQEPVEVPEDGQVYLVGLSDNNKKNLLPNVHVNDRVTVEGALAESSLGDNPDLPAVDAALGAGPRLLTNGAVDIDVARDGFTDPKITTQANVRSFIGTDEAKHMVMGTMSAATIADMAQVLLQLGLTDAMNLDGGASSALYYNGAVVTSPGRLLSNAWIVEQLEHPHKTS